MKPLVLFFIMMFLWSTEAKEEENAVEPRGKGLTFALISHFFYVVATKVIVLKIIYGGLFFALIYKGWNFVLWFIHYLKKKEHYHEYIDDHHFDHGHYGHGHFDHGPLDYGHYNHGHFDHSSVDHGHYDQFDSFDHQPYGYDKHGFSSDYNKRVYDADGSYAVKRE